MERQGCRRELQPFADHARGKTVRALLHKHAEDRQPVLLRQGGQRGQGVYRFHNSNNMET